MRWEVRTLPSHAGLSISAILEKEVGKEKRREKRGWRKKKAAKETVALKPCKGETPFWADDYQNCQVTSSVNKYVLGTHYVPVTELVLEIWHKCGAPPQEFPTKWKRKLKKKKKECQWISKECYLSEVTGTRNKCNRKCYYLALRQVPQHLSMRSTKIRSEQKSARKRRLGERDSPGNGNSMCKGLKGRKHDFFEEAEESLRARGWWERVLEWQTEA